MLKKLCYGTFLLFFLSLLQPLQADTIYMMGTTGTAQSHLTSVGHTVSTGGTLSDYSSFDQVWDLRHSTNLTAADNTAFDTYLAQGGRMYLTGEHESFDGSRNNTLLSFLSSTGAGTLSLVQQLATQHPENFTAQGQALLNNNPNTLGQVNYNASRGVSVSQGNGFLVTENSPGIGSMVAWDFGDIAGKSSTRMIVGFDINMFDSSGQVWTENLASFLSSGATPVVPEVNSFFLFVLGLFGLTFRRVK